MASIITLTVNGKTYNNVSVPDLKMPLLWVLRDILGLTGTKYGCGIEICAACTVLVDNQREKSCDMDVGEAIGRQITTIEGLSSTPGAQDNPVQQAWIQNQVPQCGYCQSGMIMACESGRRAGHHGTALVQDMSKNICICGTYQRIRDAVKTL